MHRKWELRLETFLNWKWCKPRAPTEKQSPWDHPENYGNFLRSPLLTISVLGLNEWKDQPCRSPFRREPSSSLRPRMVLCSPKASKAAPHSMHCVLRSFALSLHWRRSLNTHLGFHHQSWASRLAWPWLAGTSADVLRVTHEACGRAGGWRSCAMWSSSPSYSPHTHSCGKRNGTQWCLWLEIRPEHIIICYEVWQAMTSHMGQAPGSDKWGIISLHLIDSELRAVYSLQDLNQWPKSERLFFPC